MNTALEQQSIAAAMNALGKAARAAAAVLARTDAGRRDEALRRAADAIRSQSNAILAANSQDMRGAEEKGLTGAMLDRITHHVTILEANGESYRLNQSRSRRKTSTPK